MKQGSQFKISVLGAFDLVNQAGDSVRPTGRKDCAVIAMLALSRKRRQTRTWLQEKLWGDRGPAQAAASLRQSLSVLRSILNKNEEVIGADRTWVWLNPEHLAFDHEQSETTGELLQGFDLRDEGFNEWLRSTRSATIFGKQNGTVSLEAIPPERHWYIEVPFHSPDPRITEVSRMVVDALFEAVHVVGLSSVVDKRHVSTHSTPRATDLSVKTSLTSFGDDCVLSLIVTDGFGSLTWQKRIELSLRAWISIRSALLEVVQQFQDYVIRSEAARHKDDRWSAHSNGCQALMGLVVPGSMPLTDIVQSSEAAISADEKGLYHAFLGQAHLRLYGERELLGVMDTDVVMDSVRTALEMSPGNGLVQAFAGHSFGFFLQDLERNAAMTSEAVRILPGSAICWIFHAISLVYNRKYKEAADASTVAVTLARGTLAYPQAKSTQLFARLMMGDAKGAIASGEEAVDSLRYRPTVTDLMTAYALDGQYEEGRKKLDILKAREPDLSVDMLKSPDYPIVNSQHRQYIINSAVRLGLH